jgi:hypothetical protein
MFYLVIIVKNFCVVGVAGNNKGNKSPRPFLWEAGS